MTEIDISIKFNEDTLTSLIKIVAYNHKLDKIHSYSRVVGGMPTPAELSYYYRDFMDDIKVISHSSDYGAIIDSIGIREKPNNEE